ncbi:MAG: class IV adenylate cyclase [Sphaerochaetaceae bacterium]|nr:class IV adenylate cyclase [Spirochaetales bacterium]MDY5498522.1 class IV adenylate cyclase [Sphaerochaetaceae bacterium]
MGIEVELKAHVHDPEAVKAKLPRPLRFEEKTDLYWRGPEESRPRFRTRYERNEKGQGDILFTLKEKSQSGGIETNQEFEFTAPGKEWERVRSFVERLGYQVAITKHKKGYESMIPVPGFVPAHAELLEVEPLGWFIEIEFVLDRPGDIPRAKAALSQVLEDLGVQESEIEPRAYNDMLREARTRS